MTYTIKGKQYTESDINVWCAKLLGLIVQDEFEKRIGFTEEFHKLYPNTVWCSEVDERGDQVSAWEQMVFTRCPENTWPIIDKCWDSLTMLDYGNDCTTWETYIQKHNCTKLIAACICLIELNE
jgi:hypothetical protein